MEEQIGGKYRMELSQTQFSLSTDSIVLADFARVFSGSARVCDLGCGCGALGLLLLAKCETLQVTGVEIQEPAARCAAENAAQNGLSQFSVLHGDLREYRTLLPANGFDIVVSNPPYYPVSGGAAPDKLPLAIARSEALLHAFRSMRMRGVVPALRRLVLSGPQAGAADRSAGHAARKPAGAEASAICAPSPGGERQPRAGGGKKRRKARAYLTE